MENRATRFCVRFRVLSASKDFLRIRAVPNKWPICKIEIYMDGLRSPHIKPERSGIKTVRKHVHKAKSDVSRREIRGRLADIVLSRTIHKHA